MKKDEKLSTKELGQCLDELIDNGIIKRKLFNREKLYVSKPFQQLVYNEINNFGEEVADIPDQNLGDVAIARVLTRIFGDLSYRKRRIYLLYLCSMFKLDIKRDSKHYTPSSSIPPFKIKCKCGT